jgi:hypothetical protein
MTGASLILTSFEPLSNLPFSNKGKYFKGTKEDDMIKALSEMTPEVRRYIAEVTYAPSKNKQSRIELFILRYRRNITDYLKSIRRKQFNSALFVFTWGVCHFGNISSNFRCHFR